MKGSRGYLIPLIVIIALAFSVAQFGEQGIVGGARIQSGDRLVIDGRVIRLQGIAAPAVGERCLADGKEWDCGRRALIALSRAIDRGRVSCEPQDGSKDGAMDGPAVGNKRGKITAVCQVGGVELNALMVRNGWARAGGGASAEYIDAEKAARLAGKGIWRGQTAPASAPGGGR